MYRMFVKVTKLKVPNHELHRYLSPTIIVSKCSDNTENPGPHVQVRDIDPVYIQRVSRS